MTLDLLLDLGLPGVVFLGLCAWLIRKAARAARTEADLEGERLQGALGRSCARHEHEPSSHNGPGLRRSAHPTRTRSRARTFAGRTRRIWRWWRGSEAPRRVQV